MNANWQFRWGSLADLRKHADDIVVGEKGYYKIRGLVLQSVPVKYASCYYNACGKLVGVSGRMCLKELDEDALGIINVRAML